MNRKTKLDAPNRQVDHKLKDFRDLLKKLIELCESDRRLRDTCVTLGVYGAKLVELQESLLGFDLLPHQKILRVRVNSTGAAIEFGGLPAEIEAKKYLKSSKVIPSFAEGHAFEFDDEASGMPHLKSDGRWKTTKEKIVFLAKHWLDFQFDLDDAIPIEPMKPKSKRPRRLVAGKDDDWIKWEEKIYMDSEGDKLGAKTAWNKHMHLLKESGIAGPDEYESLHKRKRDEAKRKK